MDRVRSEDEEWRKPGKEKQEATGKTEGEQRLLNRPNASAGVCAGRKNEPAAVILCSLCYLLFVPFFYC
jgi:hypothetical protein